MPQPDNHREPLYLANWPWQLRDAATPSQLEGTMGLSNDSPITRPEDDLYGLDPFAQAIAKSIAKMPAPEGLVVAINGPWGSGKSSAINLIKHHLKPVSESGSLEIVNFNPWWFRGSDALTVSFLRELAVAIGGSLPSDAQRALSRFGSGVATLGPLLSATASIASGPLGPLVGGAADYFGQITKNERPLDREHDEIAKALREQKRRFLVIIDDIDRLSPDDAITVFRLVKSVGRLPNVIYMLSFDRALAEAAVAQAFRSEGPAYLEKIVQVGLDLPPPSPDALRNELVAAAFKVMGQVAERQYQRFGNVFLDIVAPLISTPRDITRIINDLRVTWPAVADEVDRTDFLALSALKLLRPQIYAGIRANPDLLCGQQRQNDTGQQVAAQYDKMLGLDELPNDQRDRWRISLRRLFPRLAAVWGNTWWSGDSAEQRDRLIASRKHFDIYFAFSLSPDVLGASEIPDLIERASDEAFVQDVLRTALSKMRPNGATRASLILDELLIHAPVAPEERAAPLISAIFGVADELDVDADNTAGFMSMGGNRLRIHWLCNTLITERFDLGRRDVIYMRAAQGAPFGWLMDFADRCKRYYKPDPEVTPTQSETAQLVSERVADEVVDLALRKVRTAATDGELAKSPRLSRLLFDWARHSPEGAVEVRRWTDANMVDEDFVIALAKAMISTAVVSGFGFGGEGDRVGRKVDRADVKPYAELVDIRGHEARVDEILGSATLAPDKREFLTRYKSLPRKSHSEE